MLNRFQDLINGESFREVNRRRRSRRGIRENLHRLSAPGWIGMTMVASLSKYHSGLIPYSCVFLILVVNFCLQSSRILQIDRIPVYLPV